MTATLAIIACAVTWMMGTVAANAQHLIPANPLSKQTAKVGDYEKVATYFHYQELVFRARAQNAIDCYATHPRKYPMATKTVTRAEVMERIYHEYLSKAEKNARLAADYDQVLVELGSKPRPISKEVVSVKDLEEAWVVLWGIRWPTEFLALPSVAVPPRTRRRGPSKQAG